MHNTSDTLFNTDKKKKCRFTTGDIVRCLSRGNGRRTGRVTDVEFLPNIGWMVQIGTDEDGLFPLLPEAALIHESQSGKYYAEGVIGDLGRSKEAPHRALEFAYWIKKENRASALERPKSCWHCGSGISRGIEGKFDCGSSLDARTNERAAGCITRVAVNSMEPILEHHQMRSLIDRGFIKKVCNLERYWSGIIVMLTFSDSTRDMETYPSVRFARSRAKDLIEDPHEWKCLDAFLSKDHLDEFQ